MRPGAAALDESQVRSHLLRHLSGLEALVVVRQASTIAPAEIGHHRVMVSRLEGVLAAWQRQLDEVTKRK
jgi:hypothetical protein